MVDLAYPLTFLGVRGTICSYNKIKGSGMATPFVHISYEDINGLCSGDTLLLHLR